MKLYRSVLLSLFLLTAGANAWAYSPFTQPVTITSSSGSTTACDIGPPYIGATPAAATQAGMTTCAANYDFTQTQSFTDLVGTHQWSNLGSWLSCAGSTGSPFLWRIAQNDVGCDTTHQNVTTDGGVQVFTMSYYLTDWNANNVSNRIHSNSSASAVPGDPFPQEYYIEFVMRVSLLDSAPGAGFSILWDISNFTDVQGNPCFVNRDQEFDSNTAATGVGLAAWNFNCPNGGTSSGNGPTSGSNSLISTSYGTFGSLVTGDGQGPNYGACDYWKTGVVNGLQADAFGSCLTTNNFPAFGTLSSGKYTVTSPANATILNNPMFIYIIEGPQFPASQGLHWTVTAHTTYIQRITVWACSGYKTGPCITNPVVTTHP